MENKLSEFIDTVESGLKKITDEKEELKKEVKTLAEKLESIEILVKRPMATKEGEKNMELKKAFFNFVRHGVIETKALVEDTTGQILVPEDLQAEIMRALPKLTIMRNLATVRQTNRDRLRYRSLTEVSVGWGKLETGAAITESTPTPSEAYQYVEDLYGLVKIGEDELMDSDQNLESIIVDSFARAIAAAEDTAFIAGTGHANGEPDGILNGTTVTRVTAGQAGAITIDDILDLIYAVPAQYRKNGVLIVNSKTELALRKLKDNDGQYLWQPAVQAGAPATFAGFPIYNQDDIDEIPAAGSTGNVAIFGDIKSGYRIIDRLGITVQRLNELYAESGLVGIKVHYRVGGSVIRPDAMRVLQVPAT